MERGLANGPVQHIEHVYHLHGSTTGRYVGEPDDIAEEYGDGIECFGRHRPLCP